MKNLIKLFALAVLLHGAPSCSMAQTTGVQAEFNSVWGIDYKSNMVKQPSAQKNVNDVVLNGGATVARTTTLGLRVDNIASYGLTLPAASSIEFVLIAPNDDQTEGNCGFAGEFKGTAAGAVMEITDGSNNPLSTVTLTTETGWRGFRTWHPCAALGQRKVRVRNPTGSTITFNAGKLYYGRMEPGAGVPPNTFTAEVSSGGTVSNLTPVGSNWISDATVTDTSLFTHPLNGMTGKMNCNVTASTAADGGAVNFSATIVNNGTTSTQLQYRTSAGGTKSALVNFVRCTKTGSDYIQPAITPNQWNFGTRNSTPTWTNLGFTAGTNVISYSRSGDRLIAGGIVEYASGTGSVSALTLTLPEGLSIDTTKLGSTSSLQHFGSWFWYDDSGGPTTLDDNFGPVTSFGANSVRFYVPNDLAQFRTNVMAANDRFSFNFSVPILGWTENQGAPQLVGSVTTDDNSAVKMFSARVETICTASPCTIASRVGPNIGTITRTSTGQYDVPYSGLTSIPEHCTCRSVGANLQNCFVDAVGTSTLTLYTTQENSNTRQDGRFSVQCWYKK